jgi:hypothetical protein
MATATGTLDFLKNAFSALVLAGFVALAGFGVYQKVTAKPEAPARAQGKSWESTLMTVYPVGKPLQVNGCTVTVHRIATSDQEIGDMTMATAQCDSATVTTTRQVCGKNCVSTSTQLSRNSEVTSATPES